MDKFDVDEMHVVEPRAAGIDVHKMQRTVSLRLCEPGRPSALTLTGTFATHPQGLRKMAGWLAEHEVGAATMEGTGIYWEKPYRTLEAEGVRVRLVHAQHVKQIKGRKTDVADSLWLARICQFGLARASFVPSKEFSDLRQLCRYRRKVVRDRARLRHRIHKTVDREGLHVGGVLSDLFGVNGRRILDGLVSGLDAERILAGLTAHVRGKLDRLARALEAELDPHSLWRLQGLLQDCDAIERRIRELDQRVRTPSPPTTGGSWTCWRPFPASGAPAPMRFWPRSARTWRGRFPAPRTWPRGRASARATTRAPASGAPAAPAAATRP